MLDDALYTYVFADKPYADLSQHLPFAGFVLSASRNTSCVQCEKNGRALLLMGFCVDAHGEVDREDIASYLLDKAPNLQALLTLQDRLAGRYILLYRENEALIALGDAVSSMAIYYSADAKYPCFASVDCLVAEICGHDACPLASTMRKADNPSYPLPGDCTDFEGVHCLLPNHFLDVRRACAVRYAPASAHIPRKTARQAAAALHPLLQNIAHAYTNAFDFAMPLTAGADSRLTMSYLRSASSAPLPAFSFKRSVMNEAFETDARVAGILADKLHMDHRVLAYESASPQTCAYLKRYLGASFQASLASWPTMFARAFPGRSLYGGLIIDQLGKCGFSGHKLPDACASAAYLTALCGFYADDARRINRAFVKELKAHAGPYPLFDMYCWEWHMARWGNRHTAVYSLLGVNHLNLYNCREVIAHLLSVPRRERACRAIHLALYREFEPALLELPINPVSRSACLRKKLVSTCIYKFLKPYLLYAKRRFAMRLRREKTRRPPAVL